MLKDVVVQVKNICEQMRNYNRKMETINMSKIKSHPQKTHAIRMKNFCDALDTSEEEICKLNSRLI